VTDCFQSLDVQLHCIGVLCGFVENKKAWRNRFCTIYLYILHLTLGLCTRRDVCNNSKCIYKQKAVGISPAPARSSCTK
jgi:hypothetical protein